MKTSNTIMLSTVLVAALIGLIIWGSVEVSACDTSTVPKRVPLINGAYPDLSKCGTACNGGCYVSQTPIHTCKTAGGSEQGGCKKTTSVVFGKAGTCATGVSGYPTGTCGCDQLDPNYTPQTVADAAGC